MKKQTFENTPAITIIVVLVMIAIISGLTSCAGTKDGYGCKGKESWNKMINRINKKY